MENNHYDPNFMQSSFRILKFDLNLNILLNIKIWMNNEKNGGKSENNTCKNALQPEKMRVNALLQFV